MKTRHGFTLIELLIVVLIIAILAAIAVPNFLEFQTRAKVTRVRNDQRTLATALEAYHVDNGRYPIGITEGEDLGLWQRNDLPSLLVMWGQVTTPIAYMSSIPYDPFFLEEHNYYHEVYRYWNLDYDNLGSSEKAMVRNGFKWFLRSVGPYRQEKSPFVYEILAAESVVGIYDPSNGTVSFGYILRTNKGIYPR